MSAEFGFPTLRYVVRRLIDMVSALPGFPKWGQPDRRATPADNKEGNASAKEEAKPALRSGHWARG